VPGAFPAQLSKELPSEEELKQCQLTCVGGKGASNFAQERKIRALR